jgi:hypothetical protein
MRFAAALLVLALPLAVAASQWKDVLGAVQQATKPQGAGVRAAALSNEEIAAGLKAALSQGTRAAVTNLGRADGFWGNAAARIPLPPALSRLERSVRGVGMGGLVDQFHLTLNRAAEQAVPVAADVFAESVSALTLNDVRGILTGPKDAATQHFRRTTSGTLGSRFRPIVANATAKAGVAQSYKRLTTGAGPLAIALGAPTDLDGYVTQQALEALYGQVAAEEARIRANPAARSTEVLRRVFGAR